MVFELRYCHASLETSDPIGISPTAEMVFSNLAYPALKLNIFRNHACGVCMSSCIFCPTAIIQTTFWWESTCFQGKKNDAGSDTYVKPYNRSKYRFRMMR